MRIILATDAPWAHTANADQMRLLARSLRDDLHTVYWMPTTGFSHGGSDIDWEGIAILPGDDAYGNEIMKHHVQITGAHLVITRGWAGRFPNYGGGDFAWFAWHPGPIERKTLRKARKVIAPTVYDSELLAANGVTAKHIPRGIGQSYTKGLSRLDPNKYRKILDIPEDAFVMGAFGPQNPHWKRMVMAFKLFTQRQPNSILYLHTDPTVPLDLLEYAEQIGLSLDKIRYPDSYSYHRGFSDEQMAALYMMCHITLVPGRSVLPIMQSQAVGVPVLTSLRPEIEEVMRAEAGLGAAVPPVTWHEHEPLLDEAAWAAEMDKALHLVVDPEAREQHKAICRSLMKAFHWETLYRDKWRPLLGEFQADETARHTRKRLDGTEPREGKRDSNFLEDRGDVVRKYEIGGNTEDEKAQNQIVKSWGPHPNIIPILEEGEDEFGHYWFDTPKLLPLSEISEFTQEEGDRILDDIRAGLKHMHMHGCAHCDLVPKNILLTDTVDGKMTDKTRAVLFDFDFMRSGLTVEEAYLCDYEPLDDRVLRYAVPVMASGIATRGFHRVVTHVRNLPFDANWSTSKPDVPYQRIDGVGERDCDYRWAELEPDVAGKRVLDLGCNLGYFSARSLKEGAASVYAIDHDPAIVESAQKVHPELEGKVHVMELDKERPEGEFDVAFCLSVWQHLKAGKQALMDYLLTIPVIYWEDANFTSAELEHMGFKVTRLGASERGRNLFKLESRKAEPPTLEYAGGVHA